MITVHTHVINPLFFHKTKAKLEGALVVRGKFYENFFGMSKKWSNAKKKKNNQRISVQTGRSNLSYG